MQNNPFPFSPIYQPQTGLLPNTLVSPQNVPNTATPATLNLNQIEGFEPVKSFTDSMNTQWQLVKAASDSTVDIPKPDTVQIIDYWCHDFPGIKQKLYVYVVEGIRQPRVETERPTRFFYQWFSTVYLATFTPQMITEREWLKANVYAAPMVDARVSKLNAICHIGEQPLTVEDGQGDVLIQVEELRHVGADGQAVAGNQ